MNPEDSLSVVQSYYKSFHAERPAAVMHALGMVLDDAFVLESPLVEAQLGGPASGRAALAAAAGAAPFLKNADIELLYATLDGIGVVALIHFPSPAGVIVQSEHFDIDSRTRRITRLRSYYDPRKLLPSSPVQPEL
ncbi:MAG: hypothetical protein ABI429_03180 [Jatrophihabitantaceae bacterium]